MLKIKSFTEGSSILLAMGKEDAIYLKDLINGTEKNRNNDFVIRLTKGINQELMLSNEGNIKEYELTCKIVANHSKDAAKYLREEAIKLPGFQYRKDISACFGWDDTPQGAGYWNNISNYVRRVRG